MTENIETPLNIDIMNRGTKVNAFIPYGENSRFPLEIDEKVSFKVNSSEIGLYYKKQECKDLLIDVVNASDTVTQTGAYDLSSNTFSADTSFVSVLKESAEEIEDEVKTVTEKYEVIGTLPYSDATPAIGMPAGNRFTARFSYHGITELLNGKIANVTIENGTSIDYTKSAFEDDLSLVVIVNAIATTKLTVTIKWKANYIAVYEFTFKDIKLGQDGQTFDNLKSVTIILPQQIKLTNTGNQDIRFVPYKQNFNTTIAPNNDIVLTAQVAEEALYYVLQANEDIKVELI